MSALLLCFRVQSPGGDSCRVIVGGAPQAFAQCQPLIGDGSGLRLGWSLASDAQVSNIKPLRGKIKVYKDILVLRCHRAGREHSLGRAPGMCGQPGAYFK